MRLVIDAVAIEAYDLPLLRPWPKIGPRRRGWLVRLRAGPLVGLGDCAPLPALGTEDFDAALAALERADLVGRDAEDVLRALAMTTTPAARQAVETALCDLLARRDGLPLARWLDAAAADAVMVNAVYVPPTPPAAGLQDAVDAAAAAGYAVLKLKAGAAEDTLRMLAALRLPAGLRLRLDANRAWSMDEARTVMAAVAGLPIDHVEEPLRHPDIEALASLQDLVPFPMAIDESLPTLGPDAVFARAPARRVVLKPMRFGGLLPTLALARRARAAGLSVNVTSAVESAVGVRASAHLAAAIGGEVAHGLSTGAWLAADVAPPLPVSGGVLRLDATPGIGVP